MSRTPPAFDRQSLARLVSMAGDAPGPEVRLPLMQAFRAQGSDASLELDEAMLRQMFALHRGLESAREAQQEMKAIIDRLTAPPWHPAIYLGAASPNGGPTAVVVQGTSRRVVHVGESVAASSLTVGDEVFLSHDLNHIVARSPSPVFHSGEVAAFDRRLADGRLVLTSRDEEVIVDPSAGLAASALRRGDLVRWERAAGMAFELVDRANSSEAFLEEVPSETFADIGGLDAQIVELERAVFMRFHHRHLVEKYGLRAKKSVLLWGPPGTGKTMMARALVNRLRELSPSRRARFMNIKPGALHSMWYAQSEKNYREVFRVAREAGERDPDIPVVLFFDEVDAIGLARGASATHVDDRVLTAFMSELDGLEARGNVMVVASTNRRDTLDPGLARPGRLGDCVIHVPAPGRKAARAILAKHLRPGIPFASGARDAADVRDEILDGAIARLYAPNSDSEVATLMFRDGRRRAVCGCELVSGAVLAKIALVAIERACVREADTGEPGVCLDDIASAIDDELACAARVLTPANCRTYLAGLPQDVDIVSVAPVERRVGRPGRYLERGLVA